MASLTPLSKGLLALAVVGAMASAVWHLGLKERLNGSPAAETPSITPAPQLETNSATVQTPATETAASPPEPAPAAPAIPAPVPAPAPTERQTQASGLSPAENAELGRKLLEANQDAQARVHLEQAVKDGDGAAACHLGDMHLKGRGGLPANRDKAAGLYQLAQSRNTICFAPGQ